MEYELLPLEENQIYELEALEKVCFSDPWSAGGFLEEARNENAAFIVCSCQGQVLGYAGFLHVLDEGYIANVAVHPSSRRQGIGDALIKELLQKAISMKLSFLTLEVRCSNVPAISLYKKHGFSPCGVRRGFYEKPKEDALLMKFTFGDNYEDTGN